MIITTTPATKKIQQHAFSVQQKARFLMAFAATMLFLCIESVKAFTAPLSNPDTILFMASSLGSHSVAKGFWKSASKQASSTLVASKQNPSTSAFTLNMSSMGDMSHTTAVAMTATAVNHVNKEQRQSFPNRRSQLHSNTSLKMAFNFGIASSSPLKEAPPTLDMKTSINAFGSWYNKMDPVARPPDYDDDETDYTLSSPADHWPSSFEEEAVALSPSTSTTAAYSTHHYSSNNSSFLISSSSERKRQRLPRPIMTIRKIAGWFLGSSPVRHARGFGSQTFL